MAKKKISAAGRKTISAAQKKRWLEVRTGKRATPKRRAKHAKKVAFKFDLGFKDIQEQILARFRNELKLANMLTPASRHELPTTWTTGSGAILPISAMEESHLRNAISYTQRRVSHALSTSVWLSRTTGQLASLLAMLFEAERRGLQL